jgi:hypothetical protein
MIRYGAILAAFFGAMAIVGLQPVNTEAVIYANHGINQQPPTLLHLLAETGKAYNCYFTIESAWRDGEPINKMESTIVESSLMPSSVPSSADKMGMQVILDALKQGAPNLTFMQDQPDSRIVHIIDPRLLNQEGYGLAYTVKNMEFSGPIGDLLSYLNAQGIPVGPPRFKSLHEIGTYDSRTLVHVKGQNSQLRTLLSNCIPPEERRSILWVARTKLAKGAASEILFRSAKGRP